MATSAAALPLPSGAVALEGDAQAAPRPAEAAPARVHQLQFTGTAREFFGIWIVNILLSVLTLGIYSAWAKVRTKRYFYGHTLLDGSGFDYLARPAQILKGRLVVVAAFVAYVGLSQLTLWTDAVVWLVLVPALLPWVVVRALSFNRRYSSYRNIRFGFDGTEREAFGVYILLPLATILSLGLLHPYAVYRRRRYQVEHSRFGRTPFAFDGKSGGYYRIYSMAGAMALGAAVPAAVVGWMALPALSEMAGVSFSWIDIAFIFMIPAGALVVYAYIAARGESYAWSTTRIGEDRFRLDLQVTRLAWIYFTNALAIVASFGLMIPWAKVRLARYRVSRLSLAAVGSLDRHLAAPEEETAAAGEEVGEALGLGLGL